MENHPAYKYSIRLLSARDYSRAKLKAKLLERDHDDIADDLIEYLVQKRYLREDLYLEARIKGLMKKHYAPSYIQKRLNEEDINASYEQIIQVFEEWNIDQFLQVEKLIKKKSLLHNWSQEDLQQQENRAKMTRFILSKGHSWEIIKEFF